MGCFSGHLMSATSDQKLFCKLCSPFCCSFDEFVEEKVISPSYSSAILTLPLTQFFKKQFYVFIYSFGCAGSSLLHRLFSGCGKHGLFFSCGARASHCGGFSCFRAQALELSGFGSPPLFFLLKTLYLVYIVDSLTLNSWATDLSLLSE